MVNRIVLNETSYHGAGAIQEIATEATKRGFKKAFVCSDPDLVKFGVTNQIQRSKTYRQELQHLRQQELIT